MWSPIILGIFFLATSLSALPLDSEPAILLPEPENVPTLATDLMPPPLPKDEETEETKKKPVLFLINLFGVKNETGDEEVLQDDILSEIPEIKEPLASILLVVEADDEDTPVSLDEVSKDLENEGFKVEKIKGKDGEIRVVKLDFDLDDLEASELSDEKKNDSDEVKEGDTEEKEVETEISRILRKKRDTGLSGIERIRRKRHLCLKCKLNSLHEKLHGGYGGYGGGGGGCGSGNCGGGYGGNGGYGGGYRQGNTVGVIPVAIVPVNSGYGGNSGYQGHHHQGGGTCNTCGGGYQPPPPPPPPRPVCNTCGGGGYPQGGGGGGYSHASAQASASASAQSSSY